MPADPVLDRLCEACDGAKAACCKSGSVFLTTAEHAAIAAHCDARGDAEAAAAFRRLTSVHDGFAMLDQGDGCMFLDAGNRCTLHDLGLKPGECHWWPLHVYAEADGREGAMAVCLADYCCAGVASIDQARRMTAIYVEQMRAALPALRRFRAVFPGTAPRRKVMDIDDSG